MHLNMSSAKNGGHFVQEMISHSASLFLVDDPEEEKECEELAGKSLIHGHIANSGVIYVITHGKVLIPQGAFTGNHHWIPLTKGQ